MAPTPDQSQIPLARSSAGIPYRRCHLSHWFEALGPTLDTPGTVVMPGLSSPSYLPRSMYRTSGILLALPYFWADVGVFDFLVDLGFWTLWLGTQAFPMVHVEHAMALDVNITFQSLPLSVARFAINWTTLVYCENFSWKSGPESNSCRNPSHCTARPIQRDNPGPEWAVSEYNHTLLVNAVASCTLPMVSRWITKDWANMTWKS